MMLPESVGLLNDMGDLHPKTISTIKDLFRKFDLLLNNELGFLEFKGFYECINKALDAKTFKE